MLLDNMNLKQMINFIPNSDDMYALDLDVVVYVKACIISLNEQDNYDFIRYIFSNEEIRR